MTASTGVNLTAIDRRITAAVRLRNRAIAAWTHCPSTENHTAVEEAQKYLYDRLEERFNAQ